MSKAVDIFSGILFVRTRHYDDVKKVVVLQGNKPERRFFEERPQGEWIIYNAYYKTCPFCKRTVGIDFLIQSYENPPERINFCPNCGADMRGGTE